ncbi:MAG: Twin-arginine translocation protein TatC [Candidatus Ozemobacter sibiricus]|jgi:sec-independent protein translocase protein TatC|uniref:Sec-independent protein translocase protein TatC n=1 Tax=Candidatus Ozemobacter sibiricus TaxID=2268124 RepID=A0A367ZK75_9BACT|nr:MAG: Twin-arginine translocation protein TatC [Candidatus Ozemobacter sibiricus]
MTTPLPSPAPAGPDAPGRLSDSAAATSPTANRPPAPEADEASSGSLTEHLAELRTRLLICLSTFLAAFLIAWWQSERLIRWALAPLQTAMPEARLAALTVTEAFLTTIKLAGVAGLAACSPVIVWQIWRFVAPGLLPQERFWTKVVLLPAMGFFLVGVLFCYHLVLPVALRILLQSGEFLALTLSYAAFVEFELMFLLVMGMLFELPLLILFLDTTGLFPAERLRAHRRHLVVGAFVVGGVLSPPDVVSQFLVALPLLALAEAGLWLATLARTARS